MRYQPHDMYCNTIRSILNKIGQEIMNFNR